MRGDRAVSIDFAKISRIVLTLYLSFVVGKLLFAVPKQSRFGRFCWICGVRRRFSALLSEKATFNHRDRSKTRETFPSARFSRKNPSERVSKCLPGRRTARRESRFVRHLSRTDSDIKQTFIRFPCRFPGCANVSNPLHGHKQKQFVRRVCASSIDRQTFAKRRNRSRALFSCRKRRRWFRWIVGGYRLF